MTNIIMERKINIHKDKLIINQVIKNKKFDQN